MKKSVYIALGAVFCIFLIVLVVFIMDLNPKPHTNQEQIPESSVYQYLLKEYMGKLAVYEYGKDAQPQRVLDVYTRTLPIYDRDMLAQGLPVKDDAELQGLLEDYMS